MEALFKSLALIASSVLFMAVSCEIEEEPTPIVVPTVLEGHLFKSCEQTEVYANLDLFFYERQGFNLSGNKIKYLGATRTNDVGYYRFDVGSCNSAKEIEVKDGNGELLFIASCAGDAGYINYDRASGFAYAEHMIKIFTDSALSDKDTLYVGFPAYPTTAIVSGPFNDGQVLYSGQYLLPLFPTGSISAPIGAEAPSTAFWAIGKENFICARNYRCSNDTNTLVIRKKLCQMGDTIFIDLGLARNWASL